MISEIYGLIGLNTVV